MEGERSDSFRVQVGITGKAGTALAYKYPIKPVICTALRAEHLAGFEGLGEYHLPEGFLQ